MKALGIIINVLAVVVGGTVGALFRGKLKVRYQEILVSLVGGIVLVLGGVGFIRGMFPFREDVFEVTGTMLALFGLVVGTLLGVAMRIEDMFESMGRFILSFFRKDKDKGEKAPARRPAPAEGKKQRRSFADLPTYNLTSHRSGHRFVDGFVYATLIVCTNAMALTGSVDSILAGETKTLLIKAVLDFLIIGALAAVYGAGTACAALPLAVVEGTVMVLQSAAPNFMTETLVGQLAIITSVIFIASGLCLAFRKKWRVTNMLPANLVPVIYYFILSLAEKGE